MQVVAGGLESQFPQLKSLNAPSAASVMTLVYSDIVGWGPILRRLGDERTIEVTRAYHGVAVRVLPCAPSRGSARTTRRRSGWRFTRDD